jgi:hypothetical protein
MYSNVLSNIVDRETFKMQKISILYVYGWFFLNGTLIIILSHIYVLILLVSSFIALSNIISSKHTKILLRHFLKISNHFLIKVNDQTKCIFKINNYLSVILFFFALFELLLGVYYYSQLLSRATTIYGIFLIIISLLIFSIINICFGLWVQYKISKLNEIISSPRQNYIF